MSTLSPGVIVRALANSSVNNIDLRVVKARAARP
jgi:hypothetical protein